MIQADARQIPLRDGCVQCVVTSPPYYGLRDYGTPGQIGLEASPAAYVAELVAVFRHVRRILTDDGIAWLNLGDSYGSGTIGRNDAGRNFTGGGGNTLGSGNPGQQGIQRRPHDVKPKDLIGIPWRVAFALQADGWYLRSDVIWHKPNPMPESITDRPTKAHEYVFLLAKSERYYYDAAAIAEPATGQPSTTRPYVIPNERPGSNANLGGSLHLIGPRKQRNKRSVWTITSEPYVGAHFAVMPEALITLCILAGSRMGDRVFDPFLGSGTVGAVAERLGRKWVGLDLNPAYHALAKVRTAQRGLPW